MAKKSSQRVSGPLQEKSTKGETRRKAKAATAATESTAEGCPILSRMLVESGIDVEEDPQLLRCFARSVMGVSAEEAERACSLASGDGPVYEAEFQIWRRKNAKIKLRSNTPAPVEPHTEDYQDIKGWYLERRGYYVRSRRFPNESSAIAFLHLTEMAMGEELSSSIGLQVVHDEASWIDPAHRSRYDREYARYRQESQRWHALPQDEASAFRSRSSVYRSAKDFEYNAEWAACTITKWRKEMLPFCKDPEEVCDEDLISWSECGRGEDRRAILRNAIRMASHLGKYRPTGREQAALMVHSRISILNGLCNSGTLSPWFVEIDESQRLDSGYLCELIKHGVVTP